MKSASLLVVFFISLHLMVDAVPIYDGKKFWSNTWNMTWNAVKRGGKWAKENIFSSSIFVSPADASLHINPPPVYCHEYTAPPSPCLPL
ncbi:unnamed protein product, partial [Mesorhabditis spiculigera]